MDEDRVSITELSLILDRRVPTIRSWERDGVLPSLLVPNRDERNRRYWTKAQVKEFVLWSQSRAKTIGSGLEHYVPDEDSISRQLEGIRKTRSSDLRVRVDRLEEVVEEMQVKVKELINNGS